MNNSASIYKGGGVAEKVIAPNYTKKTYPANSYVMQDGVLYTNPNAIGTAEDWNPAHWTPTTISEVIDDKIDEVTLDPSAVALGNVHLLDEVTSFAADAKILVDSETNGPGAMPAEDLLKLTAQNALGKAFDLVEGVDYTDTSVYDATYPDTVFHPTNGPSTNSDYISYGLVVTTDTNLYVKSSNTVYFSICVYPSNQSFTNGVRYKITTSENTLPTESSPLAVHTREYVVISTRKQDHLRPFDIFFTDWFAVESLLPSVSLAQRHIQQVTDSIKDRLYVQKRDLTASKDIYVYVPAKVGYVRYAFHFSEDLDPAVNCSLWRLQWVDACKEDLTYIDHLSVAGEWECALKLKNADDFMGGVTHGDEIMSNVGFWVDGQEVSFAELTNGWCREFRIARKSTMYDPTDHTTATVEHGCEYAFDLGGLTLQQSVKWLVDATVTNCYMGMNLPKKSYTTKGYIDQAIDPSSMPDYTRYQDAQKIVLWDATSGVFNLFENLGSTVADYLGNNSLYFTDNGGNDYNKGYYCITYTTQQVDIPANTIWKSKTHYVYDVATDLSST